MAQRTPLQRVRVYVEPNGSYAVDHTGTIGDFVDVRFNTAALTRMLQALPDEAVVQRPHQRRQIHTGFKSATLEVGGYLTPVGTAIATGVTYTPDSVSKILKAILGGETFDEGSAVEASPSPTTTTFTVSAGEGSNFARGQLILVETTASSEVYELAMVADVSTDAITLSWALTAAPASTGKVLNMANLYPATVLPSAATSLQWLVEGEDRDLIWLALGCQGPLNIEWPLGGMPMWSSTQTGAKWLHDDDIATPLTTSSTLSIATIDGGTPVPVTAGSIVISAISGTARTLPTIAEIAFTTGISWQSVDSYNGVEGKAQMAFVRGEQPTASVLVLAEDESWSDGFALGTKYRIAAQAGNTGAGTVGICYPTCELIAEPTIEDRNGLSYWRLTFGALENEDAGAQDSDLARAPFVIGRG